jgi:hypothetical protein
MERLTEKHYLAEDHYMKCSEDCNVDMDCIDCPAFDKIVERLAAYEDTGLTPEEVTAAKVALMGKTLAEITEFEGVPLARLRELAEADKGGRCVVLPCKGYSDVDIVRDGVSYRPDHWNIHLTAYAHEQNTPSGLKVGLFGIGEVERAMEGRKDG